MRAGWSTLALVFTWALGMSSASAASPPIERGSVIFIHPDGASAASWAVARALLRGPDGDLEWDRLPAIAVYRGHMLDSVSATSNGGATSHAFGVKVASDSFGRSAGGPRGEEIVDADGKSLSVAMQALDAGIPVGLVQTGTSSEPGTACFVTSVPSRKMHDEIMAQLAESGAAVILGGGERWCLPEGVKGHYGTGVRKDERNLFEEARARGYTVVRTRDELMQIPSDTTRLFGIFADVHTFNADSEEDLAAAGLPHYNEGAPTVAEMTRAALDILTRQSDQFLLVVEEEGTDNFGNANNAAGNLEALRRADEAFGVSRQYVRSHPKTLLITTADSDAGGMRMIGIPVDESNPIPSRLPESERNGAPLDGQRGTGTEPFMAAPDQFGRRLPFFITWAAFEDVAGGVLVRAEGLNSEHVRGSMDNTDITELMRQTLFGPEVEPARLAWASGRQETARGFVFHDRNRDGVRDAGEPGVPGVLVSDGRRIVTTGRDGEYELPVRDDAAIFVIKPRDWMTSVDDQFLPRFYYLHKPNGSPDGGFRFAGVKPTGPMPEQVNFPLYRRNESDSFTVLVMADPQPYNVREVDFYARDVIAEVMGTDAVFGMSLGDLVGDHLDLFDPLNDAQSRVGIPWYNVIGNHDLNFMSPDDRYSDETYERVYGPPTYAFQYGPVHFIVLDDVVWNGFAGLQNNGLPKIDNYIGGLREDQLRFVEQYVSHVPTDKLIVLSMHIPLDGPDVHHVPQTNRLMEILSGHPHTLSLSGHMHTQKHSYLGSESGYRPALTRKHHHYNVGTASGSWWRGAPDEEGIPHTTMRDGTPNGYALIDFSGNAYSIRYKAARRPSEEQLRIFVQLPQIAQKFETGVYVNVYNGGERSTVRMRIDDGSRWISMHPVTQPDPSYVLMLERERQMEGIGRVVPEPVDCTHLWYAPLPEPLAPGIHTIYVETVDQFGRQHTQHQTVLVDELP